MKKAFFRCKKCLFPNTKPDLHFDKDGICVACKYTNLHDKEIDWDKKLKEFLELAKNLKENRNGNYDCIIPVSGGKDSTYQTYLITQIGKLKPLLVSFEPSYPTDIGKQNLQNLVKTFNCDLMQLKKSPEVYRKIAKIGFDLIGDHEWPNHVGIYTWPIQMGLKMNVSSIFYGESQGLIGQGRWGKLISLSKIDREWVEEYSGMVGLRLNDILQLDKTLSKEDVVPYAFPSEKLLKEKNITPYFAGNFFKWDVQKIIPLIKKFGWNPSDIRVEGDYGNFEDLDCGFMPIHQYFKFIKYGYARATDHASYELRHNRITKKEAKEKIIEFEGKLPKKYFKEFLKFLDINENHFFKTRDRFSNPVLFKKDEKNNFMRGNDDNLLLKDLWYESFNA